MGYELDEKAIGTLAKIWHAHFELKSAKGLIDQYNPEWSKELDPILNKLINEWVQIWGKINKETRLDVFNLGFVINEAAHEILKLDTAFKQLKNITEEFKKTFDI